MHKASPGAHFHLFMVGDSMRSEEYAPPPECSAYIGHGAERARTIRRVPSLIRCLDWLRQG